MRKAYFYLKHMIIVDSKTKLNFFLTITLITAVYFLILNSKENEIFTEEESGIFYSLKSKCSCRKNVTIKKINDKRYLVNRKYYINSFYDVTNKTNPVDVDYQTYIKNYNHTCGLYNVLRRGPNQKVIGFSIYGTNVNYYKPLLILAEAVKKHFPGWIMRIHHSNSIDQSVACEYECNEDIIDFCNVEEMPVVVDNKLNNYKAYYPHAMMWRWYPIGDDFVDYFASRDSDSIAIQREKDSVDVWLYNKTDTLFHIMRDNPYHNIEILGGMWGYANIRNRTMGKQLLDLMLSNDITQSYNSGGHNFKGSDQSFLRNHVWPHAEKIATIHDAYSCRMFGGDPFPTRRPSDRYCFAACFWPCCDISINQTQRMPDCPIECRPKDHQDWNTC